VKVIHETDANKSPDNRRRFVREARAASQIDNEHVVRVIEADADAAIGVPFIVMELLEGTDLEKIISRTGALDAVVVTRMFIQACRGLSAAHARGTVHRDVKPANLFLTIDGAIKVLDFGVARIASSKLTRSGLIVGTPDYMSPEQVTGTVVDQRSDVFSAGAVFYQLLTGRKPFGAKTLPMILNKVMSETPPAPTAAEAPPDLAAIVMKALEKDPAKRYQRMVDMLASLTRFLQGWDRQTREVAVKACETYQAIERRIAEKTAAGEPLGDEDKDVAAARFLRDLPLFQDRGADVLKVVPFRRARIEEITRVLDAQRARLGV